MLVYHWQYPYQYWTIMSAAFGFTSALWSICFQSFSARTKWITSLLSIQIAVFLASIPGAVLWAYHDMRAGIFHGFFGSLAYMLYWIPTGVLVGQLLMLVSVPFNLIAVFCALVIINKWGARMVSLIKKPQNEFK
jgi:hypothetical protein